MSIMTIGGDSYAVNGKRGIMKPDENGYYDVTMGGLNVFNSCNEYYSAQRCLELFNDASSLMRRIRKKALYAENGHPRKEPGMSYNDYYKRVMSILESNVCAHISSITLDLEFGKKNPDIANKDTIAIMGKIAPSGPFASVISEAVNNPMQNLAFSKRTLTQNETDRRGTVIKHLQTIITFDKVLEGGITFADKHTFPSLESFHEEVIDKELFKEALESQLDNMEFESSEREFHETVLELLSKTKRIDQKNKKIMLW